MSDDIPGPKFSSRHDDSRKCWWVDSVVHIRDNETGEVRQYEDEQIWRDGDVCAFIWSEGNFGCDCNRQLFFWRAAGEPEHDDYECGHSKFSVRIINPVDGSVIYDEWEVGND